jgi:hypothetical protein
LPGVYLFTPIRFVFADQASPAGYSMGPPAP